MAYKQLSWQIKLAMSPEVVLLLLDSSPGRPWFFFPVVDVQIVDFFLVKSPAQTICDLVFFTHFLGRDLRPHSAGSTCVLHVYGGGCLPNWFADSSWSDQWGQQVGILVAFHQHVTCFFNFLWNQKSETFLMPNNFEVKRGWWEE